MKNFYRILIFIFVSGLCSLRAQNADNGTFQFLYFNQQGNSITLNDDELAHIESLRAEAVPVYVRYSEIIVIKILPKNLISDASFVAPSPVGVLTEDSDMRLHNYAITPFWEKVKN